MKSPTPCAISPPQPQDVSPQETGPEDKTPGMLLSVLLFGAVLGLLVTISRYNFLLFHTLTETLSIAVSVAVFLLVWNSRNFALNPALVVLGIGYLCTGIIELMHVLAYKNMGVFVGPAMTDISIQLGLAGRIFNGFSLLLFAVALGRRWPVRAVLTGFLVVTGLLLASIFWWRNFPSCYIEGSGLTSFKKSTEYLVSLVLFLSLFLLSRRRKALETTVYRLIAVAIVLTIGVEIFLTLYADVFGLSNVISHCLKIISYFLIYTALIRLSLKRPYTVLFRELEQKTEELREKEEHSRQISAITSDITYSCMAGPDHTYAITWMSGASERIFGYSIDEVKAMGCWCAKVHENDMPILEEYVTGLHPGSSGQCEIRLRHKNGEIVWVASSAECVQTAGQPQMLYGGLVDITERKKAEESLKKNRDRLARINDCLLGLGTDYDVTINRLTGLCGELLGADCALYNRLQGGMFCAIGQWQAPPDFKGEDIPAGHICSDVICENSEEAVLITDLPRTSYWLSDPYVRAYGLQTYFGHAVRCSGEPVGSLCLVYRTDFRPSEDDHKIIGIIASAIGNQDRRKQAEVALHESEEKYRVLFHNELYAISIFDQETLRFLDINDAFQKLYGYSRAELMGGITIDDISAEPRETERTIQQMILNGTTYVPLRFHKKKDGTVFPVEIVGGPYSWQGKKVMFCVARDISERRQAEEALQEAHRRLDAIVEFYPDATFVIDAQGKVTHWNRAVEEMTGVLKADMLGKGGGEYAAPFYGHRRLLLIDYATAISSGTAMDIKGYDLIQREGDWFLGEAFAPQVFKGRGAFLSITASVLRDSRGEVIGAIESIRDITDHKLAEDDRFRLERQVLQAQKLESLSRMAGAIAHHFNNMLGIVIGNLELAMDDVVYGAASENYIAEAIKASQRAAGMSRLMLTYLGQTTAKKERLDLARVVGDARSLFSASIPAHVRMTTEVPFLRLMIHADGVQIQQVLTNLVSNAVEAIGEKEGRITLAVEMAAAEKIRKLRFLPVDWSPKESSYACLSVADNGSGLDAAAIDKVFDPFYTTKFTGRGLGLSVLLGLIRANDGAVTVESRLGEGAVFQVYFPVVEHEELPLGKEEQISSPTRNGGLVLVVDDEPMVRNMARTMLERRLNCQVVVAGDGHEAIDMFRTHRAELHFVLLDLSMPGMNGWQTLAAIRAIQPEIPVILTSGFDEAQVMLEKHSELPQAFLHKPYQVSDLKAAISLAESLRGEARVRVECKNG